MGQVNIIHSHSILIRAGPLTLNKYCWQFNFSALLPPFDNCHLQQAKFHRLSEIWRNFTSCILWKKNNCKSDFAKNKAMSPVRIPAVLITFVLGKKNVEKKAVL